MKILLREVTAEIEEKKSRFIAFVKPVQSVSEAEAFIASKKKQYWDAKHNCSAFIIGADCEVTRCSDDGEPSGTAGRPMLEVLLHSNIRNAAVVVTRYFGGTLLGTGGLIRAYTEAVKSAIENAYSEKLIVEEVSGYALECVTDYTLVGKIQHYISDSNIILEDTVYSDSVSFHIKFKKQIIDNIINDITELTNGNAIFSDPKECTFNLPVSE